MLGISAAIRCLSSCLEKSPVYKSYWRQREAVILITGSTRSAVFKKLLYRNDIF